MKIIQMKLVLVTLLFVYSAISHAAVTPIVPLIAPSGIMEGLKANIPQD